MPKTRKTCAKPAPYTKKVSVTRSDNLSEVRAKGNRMMRRASIMIRVDPIYDPTREQAGPFANLMLMEYEFPELQRPNATDLSSLCAPTEILMPKIHNLEFLCYGLNASQDLSPPPNLAGWLGAASVGSSVFATLRDPEIWYNDYVASVLDAQTKGDITFDEQSAARELLLIHAKPFAIRNDQASVMRVLKEGTATQSKTGTYSEVDNGKMFQCKFPQSMQSSKVWFGIVAPGMFGKFKRCDSNVWINIDYDYEKIDMKQYFWLKTQDPDSIFNIYNDTPYAKAYGPMPFSIDFQDDESSAAAYAWTSEGDIYPIIVQSDKSPYPPPHVSAKLGKPLKLVPVDFTHNEKVTYHNSRPHAPKTAETKGCKWLRENVKDLVKATTLELANEDHDTDDEETTVTKYLEELKRRKTLISPIKST
jgi:hypothetical protein